MKKRICALLPALALCLSLLSGCDMLKITQDEPEPEDEIPVVSGTQLIQSYAADEVFSLNRSAEDSMNPYFAQSNANLMFMPLIYDSILEVDEYYQVQPGIVTEYSSADGTCWYFTVDTSRKFHNGNNVTAYDAVYSIQRARNSSLYSARLSDIIGMTAMNDETFVINILGANYQFPALLNVPLIPNESITEDSPAGAGPYMLDESGTKLVLFKDHPLADSMPVDEIYLKEYSKAADIITAFEDSLIDVVTNDPNDISALGYGSANETRYYMTTNLHYIGYNMESMFFQTPGYRHCMTYAINRSSIVTDMMSGCGTEATLPVSPISPLYNQSYASSFSFDMEKCEFAYETAGVSDYDDDGKREYMVTGIPMEINLVFIVCSDSASKVAAARDIAANLTSIGITVTLRELSWDDYCEALDDGAFDMYYGEVRLSADFDLSCLLTAEGSVNYGKVRDAMYENAINDYLAAADWDTRKMNCDLMCQSIVENAPITAICFEKQQVLTHRGVASGINATQYNIFNHFENWTVELT